MFHLIPFGKRCPRCQIIFPHPARAFDRNKAQRDGWAPYCKTCKRATYAPTEVTKQKGRDRARKRMERLRREDPETVKAAKAAHYARHAERLKAKQRAYTAMFNDKVRLSSRLARQRNPELFRQRDHAKRCKRLAAPGTHTAADIRARYAAQGGRCWWCKKPVGKKYHVDHIFALAKGGTNGPENICIACPECNQRKHTKSPLEFAGRLF